jgi:hypothetical protein
MEEQRPNPEIRNMRCICGSGRKYKYCCGKAVPPNKEISNIFISREAKKVVFVSRNIVNNQLKRDFPKVAASFDLAIGDDLIHVSDLVGKTYGILAPRFLQADFFDPNRGPTCARLLNTAMTTFLGCIHLARGGYRLQCMSLSRGILETVSTVINLMMEPDATEAFHAGKLQSTKSIGIAKKVIPDFGRIYGEFSNEYVHIGSLHTDLNQTTPYKKEDEALDAIRPMLRMMSWLLFITAELAFVEDIGHTRYWKIVGQRENGNEVVYSPSDAELKWQKEYFEGAAHAYP